MMHYTILTNFKDKHTKDGFACTRRCTYCNWKSNPNLPKNELNLDKLEEFLLMAVKNKVKWVTISGGGDPLFEFGKPNNKILNYIYKANAHGLKIRVITRELSNIGNLLLVPVSEFSISLDNSNYKELKVLLAKQPHLKSKIVCSKVAPPIKDLKNFFIDSSKEAAALGIRMYIRENNLSVHGMTNVHLPSHPLLTYIPISECGENTTYLIDDQIANGIDTVVSISSIFRSIAEFRSDVYFFGSFARNVLGSDEVYNDIDIIVEDKLAINEFKNIGFTVFENKSVLSGEDESLYCEEYTMRHSLFAKDFNIIIYRNPQVLISTLDLDISRFYLNKKLEFASSEITLKDLMMKVSCKNAAYLGNVYKEKLVRKMLNKGYSFTPPIL